MFNCSEVVKLPNKLNIKYNVQHKPVDPLEVIRPIVAYVKANRVAADKRAIFCPTYSERSVVFYVLVGKLGQQSCLYLDGSDMPICNIFTAATDSDVKDSIVKEFTKQDGTLRITVATIVFGMGMDAPNIRHVIHWGPSSNIESYVQESG